MPVNDRGETKDVQAMEGGADAAALPVPLPLSARALATASLRSATRRCKSSDKDEAKSAAGLAAAAAAAGGAEAVVLVTLVADGVGEATKGRYGSRRGGFEPESDKPGSGDDTGGERLPPAAPPAPVAAVPVVVDATGAPLDVSTPSRIVEVGMPRLRAPAYQ